MGLVLQYVIGVLTIKNIWGGAKTVKQKHGETDCILYIWNLFHTLELIGPQVFVPTRKLKFPISRTLL